MDISKEYIKMCNCPEIQGQRKPKVEKMPDDRWHKEWELESGDFIAVYSTYNLLEIEIKGTTIYDPYFYDQKEDADIDISTVGFDEGDGYTAKKIVWLPRQDQIQEIMEKSYDHISTMITYFNLFSNNEEMFKGLYGKHRFEIKLKSMEQLWLAFYMYEKHNKIWDGKKWDAGSLKKTI